MNDHPPFPTMPLLADYALLLQFFKEFPRRGPGSEPSTLRALDLCRLPANPAVADLGCGAGASALILAQQLQVPILALDADGVALDTLWQRARDLGLLPLLRFRSGDMAEPGIEPASLDLIWSEGAIAHVGWEAGLRRWRELLRPGGHMALTDATWLTEDPPEEARSAWAEWYPGMGTVDQNLRIARELGLEVVGHFPLPAEDWWAYFHPVEVQCDQMANQPEFASLIEGMRQEINLYRRTGNHYGYVFYVLRQGS